MVWLSLVVLVSVEILLRVYYSTQIGSRVLLYGLPSYRNELGDRRAEQLIEVYDRETEDWNKDEQTLNTVYTHENEQGGYLKFFPNEKKFHKDVDTGEVFPVTINSHGFRGKEFSVKKYPGTIRVLALGASSTVGLWSRDHQTYPVQLENMLNERCGSDQNFEVINFAIPHAISDQILAMFIAEGLALDPDIVTFYEGRNDSFKIHPMEFRGGRSGEWEQEDKTGSLTYLKNSVINASLLARLVDEITTNSSRVSADRTLGVLDAVASRTSREFINDLERIRKIAESKGIMFIVISQQANSKSWYGLPREERLKLKGFTYQDEVDEIYSLINVGESISGYEFNFLVHDRLMKSQRKWAKENQLNYIDFIEILDQDRHQLVSWVHLSPQANTTLAKELADRIIETECQVSVVSGY